MVNCNKDFKIQNGPGRYGVFAFADKIEGGKEEQGLKLL